MIYTEMTKKALKICYSAHEGQLDKGGVPYALHPIHVAEQMDSEDEICTALLHDVVEDSSYSLEDIKKEGFPAAVTDALGLLTRDDVTPYMEYILRIRKNPIARKVKRADLLHNSDLGRLKEVGDTELKRRMKYLIAAALLEDRVTDSGAGCESRKLPLDQRGENYLIINYSCQGEVLSARFDLKEDSFEQYALTESELAQALASFSRSSKSFPERMAERLDAIGIDEFIRRLHESGVREIAGDE